MTKPTEQFSVIFKETAQYDRNTEETLEVRDRIQDFFLQLSAEPDNYFGMA